MQTLRDQLVRWLACGTLAGGAVASGQDNAPAAKDAGTATAQPAAADGHECGTLVTPEHVQRMQELVQAGVYQQQLGGMRGGEPWYVPVTLHVVRQSDGTGGLSEERLNTAMNDANAAFAATPLRFVKIGATRFINSDNFFFNIDTMGEINNLKMTDVVCGTVNIYFTPNLAREDGPDDGNEPDGLCGISSFSDDPIQGIVMSNSCTALDTNHSTFPHEIGHYFDLYHTHETAFGAECVDGSNCGDEGDLLCDTPADPGLSADNVNNDCTYSGSATDSCEGDPYNPQVWNFMSYADPKSCRTAFTGGQHNRALVSHVLWRLPQFSWTACGCAWIVWVDANSTDVNAGNQWNPFDHFAEAVPRTCSGGAIYIRPGTYSEGPITINQAVTLKAVSGLVSIGG